MNYKTILVFLDERDHCDSLLNAAVRLASVHEAHLIGVAIQRPFEPYIGYYADLSVSMNIDEWLISHEKERLSDLHAKFEAHTRTQNIIPEWRALSAHPHSVTETLLQQACAAELLIIGAGTDTTDSHPLMRDRRAIATNCACPVLSLPSEHADEQIGDNVLIAWDGSVQASRAIFRMMPVLLRANRVWLHRVSHTSEEKNNLDDLARDMANALSRKGVELELGFSQRKVGKVGEELLNIATVHGADSIVMGAYAHSRVRDLVLGGATRYLLEHATIPVFFGS